MRREKGGGLMRKHLSAVTGMSLAQSEEVDDTALVAILGALGIIFCTLAQGIGSAVLLGKVPAEPADLHTTGGARTKM